MVSEPAVAYRTTSREIFAPEYKRESEYNYILSKIDEQKRLIAEGKMVKQRIITGFSAEGQAAFDRGVTLNDILKKYNITNV